ncbi:MAG TPA: thioredoxin family protein [Polyangiaceae bacterium]|jgi:tetratricopeptide (TPR) repeat protein
MRAALALVLLCACTHAQSVAPAAPAKVEVPRAWIEDDYARALAEAKKDEAPLFVDVSAVWCHTCKAMRAFVLDDATLPRGFVRFSFDVEKEQNAAAAAAFPAHVLPTFFVVDPRDGSIHGRWEGAGSVAQMRAFMRDAARSIAMAHASELRPDDPLALLLAGDRAALKNDAAESEKDLSAALARAPRGWDHETEAMLGLLKARKHLPAGCAETAEAALSETPSRLGRTSLTADYADEALDCVEKNQDARARHVRELVAQNVADLAGDASAPLSPDDRSDAWRIVWEARESLGDHPGALDAARKRLDVIMKAVAAQPDPERTTTFDGARMETLEFLGRPEDAARFLEAQEKALPDDYNPAHRLARVDFDLKKYPEALAAIDRAIAKGYGARKGLMLRLKADILIAMGNKTEARKTLEEQLALYRSLPEGQKKPAFEKAVQKRLDELR